MHVQPEAVELKRSALALLSSGNGIDAVAGLLRVPVDRVAGWMREGPDAAPVPPEAPPEADVSHAPHRVQVDPTGFIALPSITRAVAIGLPLVMAAFFMALGLHATLATMGLLWLPQVVMLVGVPSGIFAIAYGIRGAFALTRYGVESRGAIGTRVLPYAGIESCRVCHRLVSSDYEIALKARPGGRDATIWLKAWQLQQPDVADWLATLPCTGFSTAGRYYRVGDVKRDWTSLLVSHNDDFAADRRPVVVKSELERDIARVALGGMRVVVSCLGIVASVFGGTFIYMGLHGPAPLSGLHTTQGRVANWTPCMTPRRVHRFQTLGVDTGAGIVRIEIPCLLSDGMIQHSPTDRIVIRSDSMLSFTQAYEVVFDGVVLQAYADTAAARRRTGAFQAVVGLLIIAMMVGLLVFAARLRNDDEEE